MDRDAYNPLLNVKICSIWQPSAKAQPRAGFDTTFAFPICKTRWNLGADIVLHSVPSTWGAKRCSTWSAGMNDAGLESGEVYTNIAEQCRPA